MMKRSGLFSFGMAPIAAVAVCKEVTVRPFSSADSFWGAIPTMTRCLVFIWRVVSTSWKARIIVRRLYGGFCVQLGEYVDSSCQASKADEIIQFRSP